MSYSSLFPMIWSSGDPIDELSKIDRSVRFRSGASAYLSRTFTASSTTKWTFSFWYKPSVLGATASILTVGPDVQNYGVISFAASGFSNANDTLKILSFFGNSSVSPNFALTSNAVFRDTSAWYHVVINCDAVTTGLIKAYVNGKQITLTGSQPGIGTPSYLNSANVHSIGRLQPTSGGFLDGYLADVALVDGQVLDASSFGQFHALTGQWRPKSKSVIKALADAGGTNSFYLTFDNSSSLTTLSADYSSKGNNWTANNINLTAGQTLYDAMVDSPTTNYATFNFLDGYQYSNSRAALSNGNLTMTYNGTASSNAVSTIVPTSGKYYFEMTAGNIAAPTTARMWVGLEDINGFTGSASGYSNDGQIISAGVVTPGYPTYTTNDTIGCAFDVTGNLATYFKNGVQVYSGPIGSTSVAHVPWTQVNSAGDYLHINFGQRPFYYTPPAGYLTLSAKNLAKPRGAPVRPKDYFDIATYSGNGSSQSISTVNFPPDLVWGKARNFARSNGVYDSVRGVQKVIYTDSQAAEVTDPSSIITFGTNGFTTGSSTNLNQNASSYVAWMWRAFGGTTANTDGTIASQVSPNRTSGFSIVSYTGNGLSNGTVGHGLGVAPGMIIVKARGSATSWFVYHKSLTAGAQIRLSSSNAAETVSSGTADGGLGAPNSSVFSFIQGTATVNNVNQSGIAYIAYCFTEIPGYSKIGSYTGNASTEGPFVNCGFKPKFVLIKSASDAGSYWGIEDSMRSSYNPATSNLFADRNVAETSNTPIVDLTAAGFKIRSTSPDNANYSGSKMIYIAFAESTFRYSNAS